MIGGALGRRWREALVFIATGLVVIGLGVVFTLGPSSRATPPGVLSVPRCLRPVVDVLRVGRGLIGLEQAFGVRNDPLANDTRGVALTARASEVADLLSALTGRPEYERWAQRARLALNVCRGHSPKTG